MAAHASAALGGGGASGGGGLAGLAQRAQERPQEVEWLRATVVENKEASADGSARTLLLSVEDAVTFLEGRKVRHVQEKRRWVDEYTVPGQFVAVRYCASGGSTEGCSELRVARCLQSLASSPYEARRDSALLDASLVELLVSRAGDEDERTLAELGPGSMIDVSAVAGDGFASLFNQSINLAAAMENGHPLVMLCAGSRGIAPVRAALSWTPVLAHASNSCVALYYVADSPSSAAYLVEWDTWREAGAQVHPLYRQLEGSGNGGPPSEEVLLERALFGGERGLAAVLGGAHARDAAVLMSGLEGEAAAHLTRRLSAAGVPSERIMLCDSAVEGSAANSTLTAPLPTRLNTIPHSRETRQYFYRDLKEGVMAAVAAGELRMIARCTIPELNTEFDVYRVGTLLEMVRDVVTALAADGRTVKVCVQQPLGEGVFQGMPLSLNGVMRIMGQMDWGEAKDRVKLGNLGASEVNDADAFVCISPQNIVGHSVMPLVEEMAAAAGVANKAMVLINPKLTDVQSAAGVGSVRGRQGRLDFARTFITAYHLRLLYKGVTMHPIMGALRCSYGGPWEVFRRVQLGPGEEEFVPIGAFEGEPTPPQITDAFKQAWAKAAASA
ncbi:adenylate kinase [Micractinium conductrix]|uniref:Adenylate kinase n=1 Tax=Micractinium conductrix TaxID=554055 RepID=A0A2P6VMX9_9CHLO|nr:adenylate kinase [Micractinium conductrix]|eukprot:PSC75462.1 adenylate kinase [Micractinium conductrix]